MFKTIKKFTSCLLVLCMLLSIVPMGVFASGETINYVSLGASNVNGYGLDGYFTAEAIAEVNAEPLANKTAVKMSGNVYGYDRHPAESYPSLIADYLASEGDTVNHHQLAISSMRVEELRVLLDNTYDGDEYTEWRFTDGQNWFNNALPGGLNALRADYQTKIADADLVTVDIGANNFGVFLSRYIMNGVNNSISVYDIDPEIGDMYEDAKDYVLDLLSEYDVNVNAATEEIVEILTYALVGYCYNFDVVMEKIYELNPDVNVAVVSIQNLMDGYEVVLPGLEEAIPFGDLIGVLVNAANLYTAGISPYADRYTYVDVRKDGHVDFFADQLVAWDGESALDSNVKDCFNLLDNDLYISARVADAFSSNPAWGTYSERLLEAAYNTTAKIMQAGLNIKTLDFSGFDAANTGAVENGLFDNIIGEITEALDAEVTAIKSGEPSTYEFNSDDLFNVPGVDVDLAKTVAAYDIYTSIGNSFFSHPSAVGHIEIFDAIVDAIENDTKGKDVIDDVVAKYEENLAAATTADYVACGTNHYVAFAGTNTSGNEEYEYSYNFGDYIDATDASTRYFTDATPIADAVDYINNLSDTAKADLQNATIVTYQTDAKNIVLPLVVDDVRVSAEDWAALLDVDAEKAAEIKATIIAALKGEYADEGAAALNDGVNTALEIKEEAMSKLPADWATALAAEGAKADEVIETILETAYDIVSYSLDATLVDMVAPLAEELVFNTVAYLVNNINAVEAIKETNPNALIAIVGLHNPVKGLMVSVDGQVVDLGEYVEYFIEATNVYNTIYAAASENVIFVEADETEIAGYEGTINIDTTDYLSLMQAIMTLDNKLNAGTVVTENGHNYIANQLKAAITKVDHIDTNSDNLCDKCETNLAPVTPTPTPTPTPNRPGPGGGGGGVASSFTIKFETNGGSKVDDVKVENGKSLAEPAAPTKNGFTFDGWYTDKELTKKYDFSQKVTKSFTLYAKWIEGEFKNPFVDVNEGDWFYDAVMFVLKKGITKGVSETEYAPQGKVTRAQFITMLCRAYEIEEMTGENFADCGNTWYTGYLAAAKQLGISNGVGDNMFAPEKEITREEMVTLIYNYLKSINKVTEETAELSFADSDNVSEWAKTAVAYAAKNGIVNGKGNNIFDPQGTATRAELAQIFYNMFK